jgi:putative transposase
MGLSRSVFGYTIKKSDDCAIVDQIKKIAYQHKRYGFKKIFHMIKKDGHSWNHKRVYRVYCALKFNLKRKPKKRLPSRKKVTLKQPDLPNQTWSLDYMSDALQNGRRFRTINVIDDFNREALAVKAFRTLPSIRVITVLDTIAKCRGYPQKVRMDNGPENISKALKSWASAHAIELEYIQPGKPAQNGYIERFNRSYREEILDMNIFFDLDDVQEITNQWLIEYNTLRPHHSLENMTPVEFARLKKVSTLELY